MVNFTRVATKNNNITGFTLLEVMIAMAVFAIAGVSLLGAAQNNFSNISHLEDKMLAGWVASNQLVTVSLEKTWPPKNNLKGEVELANRTWFWQQKVLKTEDKNMRAIVMEVRLQEKDKLSIASLMTYVSKAEP